MTPAEYQIGVLATASGDMDAIADRIQSPFVVHFMHAVMGLSSELGELLEYSDECNLLEELGDSLWYCTLGLFACGKDLALPKKIDPLDLKCMTDELFELMCRDLAVLYGKLLSMVKARIFYGREIKKELASEYFTEISEVLFELGYRFGATPEHVMNLNNKKLLDKQNGRYRKGKFTEEAAEKRDLAKERSVLEDAK